MAAGAPGSGRTHGIVVISSSGDSAEATKFDAAGFKRLFSDYSPDPAAWLAYIRAFSMVVDSGGTLFLPGGVAAPAGRPVRRSAITVVDGAFSPPTAQTLSRDRFITYVARAWANAIEAASSILEQGYYFWDPENLLYAVPGPLTWITSDAAPQFIERVRANRDGAEARKAEVENAVAAAESAKRVQEMVREAQEEGRRHQHAVDKVLAEERQKDSVWDAAVFLGTVLKKR